MNHALQEMSILINTIITFARRTASVKVMRDIGMSPTPNSGATSLLIQSETSLTTRIQ